MNKILSILFLLLSYLLFSISISYANNENPWPWTYKIQHDYKEINNQHNINNEKSYQKEEIPVSISDIIQEEDIKKIYDRYLNYEIEYNEAIKELNILKQKIKFELEKYKNHTDELSTLLYDYYSNLNKYLNIKIESIINENIKRIQLEVQIENKIKDKLNLIFDKQKIELLKKIEILLDIEYNRIKKIKNKSNHDILKLIKIKVINNILKEYLQNKEKEL